MYVSFIKLARDRIGSLKRKRLKLLANVPILVFFMSWVIIPSFSIPANAAAAPCDTYQVNGGDQSFLMNLNTPLEFGGTVYNGNVYVSPKGTITFGVGDHTFWDYPPSPSISIGSYDYHAFPNSEIPGQWSPGWGAGNDLYVRYGSTATSICVDWKVLPWGQTSGDPVYIRMLAEVNPVNYTWTPTYQVSSSAPAGARYGVRYTQNGEVFPLNIQTISQPPVASPTPSPTQAPAPSLNPPQNLTANLLQNGTVELLWSAPESTGTAVERYAMSWSTTNFTSNGWGGSSNETNAYLSPQVFEVSGGFNQTYQFKIRSDNDTLAVYSGDSNIVELFIPAPVVQTPIPTPTPEETTIVPVDPFPSSSPSEFPLQPVEPPAAQSPTPEPQTSSPEPEAPAPDESPSPDPTETAILLPQDNDSTEDKVEYVLDQLEQGESVSFDLMQELGLDYEDLPEDTPVELENGVILTAEVADALEIFENPSEILAAVFSDPGKALTAIANIGADMTPEKREESQKVVIAAVIAGQLMNGLSVANNIGRNI